MEFLDGQTVKTPHFRQPLPLDETLALTIQIADALVSAHARGIIHRTLSHRTYLLRNKDTPRFSTSVWRKLSLLVQA